jgi:endonuclease/exonuclease/phosphatase family metal-dependent hydrolase
VATFNVHCGVDGWGRPFDLESACRTLDADVLVLQEAWTPVKDPGTAQRLGKSLGYDVITRPFARGWLLHPTSDVLSRSSWGPDPWTRARTLRALKRRARVERARAAGPGTSDASTGSHNPPAVAAEARSPFKTPPRFQPGTWGLWVLTRIPIAAVAVLDLGKLRIDPVRREAVMLTLDRGRARRPLTVVGIHMSHLTDGSPIQYRRLAHLLPSHDVIVAGDMNTPGLLLQAMLPGYLRVVSGRTWPAWRPVIQSDHILATPGLAARARGEVVPSVRCSDHLPARARFDLD